MDGLLQHSSLTLRWIFSRLEQVFPDRSVSTARDGVVIRRRTYRDLARRARQISGALDAAGIAPGERIATFSRNTDDHLEQMLGVAASGRIFHALNPRLSHDELRYILNHAGDTLAFVDAELLEDWKRLGPLKTLKRLVVVHPPDAAPPAREDREGYEAFLSSADPASAWPALKETDAAALCYTSGTTGNPKGVLYSHRGLSLVSLAWMAADAMRISERDTYLPVVPFFHAHAWALPFSALLAGAPIILPGANVSSDAIAQLVRSEQVTLASGVPTIWSDLLQAQEDQRISGNDLSSLERLVCGGSAVPEAMLDAFDKIGVNLIQVWGMTEMSPLGTVSRVRSEIGPTENLTTRSMQGLPSPFVQLRIVDEHGEPQPWDGKSIGELQAHGPWIADGYFDPASPGGRNDYGAFETDESGQRWLKTGDIAVITPDAYVRLVDRKKDLIKSGGEWISSIDLQQLIETHPAINTAAVIGVDDPKWGARPIAFVETVAGASPTAEDLRAFVLQTRPSWQTPDRFIVLAQLPRNSLGKLDKARLRDMWSTMSAPDLEQTET